jgi:hypothetical protein
MKGKYKYRLLVAILVIVCLLSQTNGLPVSRTNGSVEAAVPIFNAIKGLIRTLNALDKRNVVYEEARATASEIHAYYYSLIARSERLRAERVRSAIAGDTSPTLVRAYSRLEATLTAERDAAIQMIEAEKQSARKTFNDAIEKEIRNVILSSSGVQRILGRVTGALGRVREKAVAIQKAVDKGRPFEIIRGEISDMVGDVPVVQELARGLGSVVGRQIDNALGGILSKAEGILDNVQGGLDETLDATDLLEAKISDLSGMNRAPVSLVEDDNLLGELLPVSTQNRVVDVAASAFSRAAQINGRVRAGADRATMLDRVRGALLDERLADIHNIITEVGAGSIYCTDVDREQFDAAASALSLPLDEAYDAPAVLYTVCYTLPAGTPVGAIRFGGEVVQTDQTVDQGEDTSPPPPAPQPAGPAPGTAIVTLTWGEPTDLDLAASPTQDISWDLVNEGDYAAEGVILADDTVCPDVSGREEMVLDQPGLYYISVGVWSGCIIGGVDMPHFASYTVSVVYSDGRSFEISGTIEGQIWQTVTQVQLP